jgi:hypothetical protein
MFSNELNYKLLNVVDHKLNLSKRELAYTLGLF